MTGAFTAMISYHSNKCSNHRLQTQSYGFATVSITTAFGACYIKKQICNFTIDVTICPVAHKAVLDSEISEELIDVKLRCRPHMI